MKVMILGGGLVGKAIAIDLAKEKYLDVAVADVQTDALHGLVKNHGIIGIRIDLSRQELLVDLIKDSDLVIGALPGFMGYRTLKTVIEAKKNIVDISFFPENSFALTQLAEENGVTAVVDCGVAPGCSNLLLGHVYAELDQTERFECYVGGLPVVRTRPYEYKVVFSPLDVIEEYTRPARIVENGQVVIRPALSELELIEFSGIGTLETFNSDGLRTLIDTMNIPFMKEKTLRFPGHAEKMTLLRETGFFSKDPVEVNGCKIQPLELTAKLLFPKLKLNHGEEDFTVMKIIIEGKKEQKSLRYEYDLLDYYDRTSQTTSMARTTGYTASVMARLLLNGTYLRPGISPLELVGQEESAFQALIQGLKERNIIYQETVEKVGSVK